MSGLKAGMKIQDQSGNVMTLKRYLPQDGRSPAWMMETKDGKQKVWSVGVIEAQFDYGNWKIVP